MTPGRGRTAQPDGNESVSDAKSLTERAEDAAPAIVAAAPGLWLGNLAAACDAATLAARGITQTLNLAVNADAPPLTLPDGPVVRRAKIGLIDGPGNAPVHLAAAALALEGMLAQAAPGKPSYPAHRPGGLLAHCRGGRSRSLAVVALHLARAAREMEWRATLEPLRAARGLGPEHPHPAVLATGDAAWAMLLCLRAPPASPG